MTTFAITAAAGAFGRALTAHLDADGAVDRIVGIDRRPPPMPPAKLDFVLADLRDPVLARALLGVDVLVHQGAVADAGSDGWSPDAGPHATGQVLEAARAAGVAMVIHVSTALVYGASETNAVPLTEQVAPRARDDYPPAHQALLTEQAVMAFGREHPELRVTVLRPVTVLGTGVESAVTRHLESPVLPMVRGFDPPVQFVDVDDLAAAVLAVAWAPQADGVYNVAADGWLTTSDVERLLARPALHLPRETAVGVAGALHRAGLLATPPGALRYLMHPWVVDTSRLRALGWRPSAGQRDILHRFVAEHGRWMSLGRIRLRTARLLCALAAAGGMVTLAAAWVTWRRVWPRRRPGGRRR